MSAEVASTPYSVLLRQATICQSFEAPVSLHATGRCILAWYSGMSGSVSANASTAIDVFTRYQSTTPMRLTSNSTVKISVLQDGVRQLQELLHLCCIVY